MLPLVLEGLGHLEFQQIQEVQHYPENDQTKGVSDPLNTTWLRPIDPFWDSKLSLYVRSNESVVDQLVGWDPQTGGRHLCGNHLSPHRTYLTGVNVCVFAQILPDRVLHYVSVLSWDSSHN